MGGGKLSVLGDTYLACNLQLRACHAAADGLRHDVLMAVITLWIVTADQGHNKTIVAAILEKVLNGNDVLSAGFTSLEPHYQFQRDSQASQAMTDSSAEERTQAKVVSGVGREWLSISKSISKWSDFQ